MSEFSRFRFRLSSMSRCLLAIVVVLGPVFDGIVSATENVGGAVGLTAGQLPDDAGHVLSDADDFHPQIAAARDEQLRQSRIDLFDSHVLGNMGFNASALFVARLDAILQAKVENSARECGLTEAQKQKLLLAGQGDIKRLFDRIHDARRQFLSEGAELEPAARHRTLYLIADPFRDVGRVGPFGERSLLFKVLRRDVSVEQFSNLSAKDAITRCYGQISTLMRNSTAFHDLEFTHTSAINNENLARAMRLPNIRLLRLESTAVTDMGLAHLKGLTSLEILDIARTPIDGRGFAHLQELTALQVLRLSGTQINDDGLANLKPLTNLTELHLQGTRITDAGLIALDLPNFVNLKEIGLSRTKVTDLGLAQFRSCTKLERLHLIRTPITDAGLANLSQMTNLRLLLLDQTRITDAGLATLGELTSLERIDLSDTAVGDAGIGRLRRLCDLRYINLANTHVTDAGVAQLKRALPELKIFR